MASKGTKEISTGEFQHKLFDWFEKRGLLSELRAFMRHRMISALYSSESPCPASPFSIDTVTSPTLQAMLLLVAEFLVQQEYHYSMSVMVAEAPLLASFPKFSGYVSYMSQTETIQKGSDFPRYSEKDVQEILEVFGMTPDSESMEHVLRLYSNNSARESLLACVLTALSVIVQSQSNETSKTDKTSKTRLKITDDIDDSTQWVEEIRLVLVRAQLTSRQLQQVEELLRKLCSNTADKVRGEERKKNKKLNHIREQELLAEALVREETFRAQTVKADEDLRNKQKHLELVTNQLRQQHDEVLKRLNRVQKHADEVKRQENEVLEREKSLERKQALFDEDNRALAGLRAELQEVAHSLRQEHSDTKTILELHRLQERCLLLETELKETKNAVFASAVNRTERGIQATEMIVNGLSDPNKEMEQHDQQLKSSGGSCCSSIEKPTDKKERNSQVTLLKRVLRRVQQENAELRAIAAQQRKRIDELTSRASQLAMHIAEQSELPSLSRTEQPASGARAPETPPVAPQHVWNEIHYGAGGNVSRAASLHSSAHPPHALRGQGRDWRRKPAKRFIQNISHTTSFSSDESPTEEVLREARNRLKRLEEESEAVDRRYRDFRARQADSLVSTASMLFADNEQTTPSFTTGQSYPDTQNAATAYHLPPSLLRSTPFQSPATARHAASSLITSVRPPSATLPSGTSTFSPIRSSQFTLPERSLYSVPQAVSSSRLSEPVSAIPFHSSMLRRPVDRLRDLLGSRPSYTRGSSQDSGTLPGDPPRINQSVPSFIPTQEKKVTSDVSRTGQEIEKLEANISPGKADSSDTRDLHGKSASTEKDSFIPNNATIFKKQPDIQQASLQYLPSKDDAGIDTNKLLIQSVSGVTKVPQTSETTSNSTSLKLSQNVEESTPKHLLNDAQQASPSLLNVEQPPSNNCQPSPTSSLHVDKSLASSNKVEHHPNSPPVQFSEIVQSPEKFILKPNPVDATLNEISTLSSSPGLSSANLQSVKTKIVSSSTIAHYDDGKENRKPPSSASQSLVEELEKKSEEVSTIPKLIQKNAGENNVFERTSHLLNTSLSSIENSEQRLSAGSGGKKTDDDDDFW